MPADCLSLSVPQRQEGVYKLAEVCTARLARMCVRAAVCEPTELVLLGCRQLAKSVRNGLKLLSMGMSADFATAIAFGATHVRVGTAIFGDRAHKKSPDAGLGG